MESSAQLATTTVTGYGNPTDASFNYILEAMTLDGGIYLLKDSKVDPKGVCPNFTSLFAGHGLFSLLKAAITAASNKVHEPLLLRLKAATATSKFKEPVAQPGETAH